MALSKDLKRGVRLLCDSKYEDAILCLEIALQSHSTIFKVFTQSHKYVWVPYVSGTPKMSQSRSLSYGITQMQLLMQKGHVSTMNSYQHFENIKSVCFTSERGIYEQRVVNVNH